MLISISNDKRIHNIDCIFSCVLWKRVMVKRQFLLNFKLLYQPFSSRDLYKPIIVRKMYCCILVIYQWVNLSCGLFGHNNLGSGGILWVGKSKYWWGIKSLLILVTGWRQNDAAVWHLIKKNICLTSIKMPTIIYKTR
mgnify:CR=1 FL=1